MMNVWLTSHVSFLSFDSTLIEIEPGATITLTTLDDGSLVGMFGTHTFDICDDEYVMMTGNYSTFTH